MATYKTCREICDDRTHRYQADGALPIGSSPSALRALPNGSSLAADGALPIGSSPSAPKGAPHWLFPLWLTMSLGWMEQKSHFIKRPSSEREPPKRSKFNK